MEALPEIVKAVNGWCEVYIDGGIRNGNDVFKALALGAKAVFIGRPAVFALAYNVRFYWIFALASWYSSLLSSYYFVPAHNENF